MLAYNEAARRSRRPARRHFILPLFSTENQAFPQILDPAPML
jgi:hypothetical protein